MLHRRSRADKKRRGEGAERERGREREGGGGGRVECPPRARNFLSFFPFFLRNFFLFTRARSYGCNPGEFIFSPIGAGTRVCASWWIYEGTYAVVSGRIRPRMRPVVISLFCQPRLDAGIEIRILLRTGVCFGGSKPRESPRAGYEMVNTATRSEISRVANY